jgi:hypothetical protein
VRANGWKVRHFFRDNSGPVSGTTSCLCILSGLPERLVQQKAAWQVPVWMAFAVADAWWTRPRRFNGQFPFQLASGERRSFGLELHSSTATWARLLSWQMFQISWFFCRRHHSQSYFTTGGLPTIGSSWRQVPWGSILEILSFLQQNRCCHSHNLSDEWIDLSLINMLGLVKCTYSSYSMLLTILPLHHLQILCQSRFCKTDHIYLTYLMLE